MKELENYDKFEQGATFVGFACIKDPARPEVKDAIKDCTTAGIRVIMITGDAPETAASIAQEVGILSKNADTKTSCKTGAEFEAMTPAQ